jgi:BirA family transcriptional regulator, biotin operon repressor / biotin---[acetyl-CoA-carboxylase] ligase
VIRLPAGYRLIFYATIGSTNDAARQAGGPGVAETIVVWALEQTAGRGRRGRLWLSPLGNLYASFALRPDFPAAAAPQLGFVAALAVGDTLAAVIPACRIAYKWPNDVMIAGCKIAGILVESETAEGGGLATVVVGIGINLAVAPVATETPATSVAALGCAAPAPGLILEGLAGHFDVWLQRWRAAGFAPVRSAWRAAAATLGQPIRVKFERAELHGRFHDIDRDGSLLLETEDGMRRISAGEVFPARR